MGVSGSRRRVVVVLQPSTSIQQQREQAFRPIPHQGHDPSRRRPRGQDGVAPQRITDSRRQHAPLPRLLPSPPRPRLERREISAGRHGIIGRHLARDFWRSRTRARDAMLIGHCDDSPPNEGADTRAARRPPSRERRPGPPSPVWWGRNCRSARQMGFCVA
jgi:hypothetical protein